jgi:hypothetical protein
MPAATAVSPEGRGLVHNSVAIFGFHNSKKISSSKRNQTVSAPAAPRFSEIANFAGRF